MSQPDKTTTMIESLADRLRPLVERIVEGEGLELVGVELARRTLRVTIEREGGVRVADCAAVSRQLGVALDVEDAIPYAYHLEVTSPGLDRPLAGPRDYARAVGRLVTLVLREAPRGSERLTGRLIEIGDGDEVHARGRAHLRQEHGAELAGADQPDGHRAAFGLPRAQQGVEVHWQTARVT